MATPVIMPKQGQSVESCIITRWFKNTGDRVIKNDILLSYETDKAAFDLESPADGILLEIFFGEGDEVPVLQNIAVIGRKEEAIDLFNPAAAKSDKEKPEEVTDEINKESQASSSTTLSDSIISPKEKRIRISPRARCLAEENTINIDQIKGSGPNGRIIVRDVEAFLSGSAKENIRSHATAFDYKDQPLSNIRKLIAKTMHTSLQNSAQLTHHMSADARNLLKARKTIKENISTGSGRQDISLNDMVCWCVIKALKKFPYINSHFLGESIRLFSDIHLGIAVDTPRGLMVPVVMKADNMDLDRLSEEIASLAEASRKGSISPELIQNTSATFTVSNLGSYGVEMFTPVINLPQTAILGVCTIINRPADLGDSTFGFVPYLGLSLTYDHRAIDGGPASLFLKEIKKQIENFTLETF
ncbi:MAG TPA: dihydrolipoamide acetyltransferase family protein [Bacteroidales bacterium]|nr:dihydrolipoamide acetyltransferase family protein [Bacteroidales bacterium]HPR73031.1 dihydrolipoamide acetyltransferase family protein [Bacteroidales bacterium]